MILTRARGSLKKIKPWTAFGMHWEFQHSNRLAARPFGNWSPNLRKRDRDDSEKLESPSAMVRGSNSRELNASMASVVRLQAEEA